MNEVRNKEKTRKKKKKKMLHLFVGDPRRDCKIAGVLRCSVLTRNIG